MEASSFIHPLIQRKTISPLVNFEYSLPLLDIMEVPLAKWFLSPRSFVILISSSANDLGSFGGAHVPISVSQQLAKECLVWWVFHEFTEAGRRGKERGVVCSWLMPALIFFFMGFSMCWRWSWGWYLLMTSLLCFSEWRADFMLPHSVQPLFPWDWEKHLCWKVINFCLLVSSVKTCGSEKYCWGGGITFCLTMCWTRTTINMQMWT